MAGVNSSSCFHEKALPSCQPCTPTGHFQWVFLGSHSADRLVASGHRLLSGCRMMWRTVKRVIPNSLGATQFVCMCLCVCVSMCGHPHTFQPEQKHWGLRCSAIPSACPSSAEEIQEVSQDVAAAQPKNGLCVCVVDSVQHENTHVDATRLLLRLLRRERDKVR